MRTTGFPFPLFQHQSEHNSRKSLDNLWRSPGVGVERDPAKSKQLTVIRASIGVSYCWRATHSKKNFFYSLAVAAVMAEQHPGARLQHPHHPGGGGAAGSAVVDDFSSSLVEAASLMEAGELAGGAGGTNKWSKNGYGNPVRRQSGKFSRSETEVVRKAVEQFCHAKQIPTSRLCSECDHKAELKGAWMEIAKALPHRSVQSVYRHGIRQLHPFKRGAWSEEECMLLADLVHKLGKKWSSIQNKINRSADSCRDKYREMSDEFTKGRWKEHDTEMLKRVIREQVRHGTTLYKWTCISKVYPVALVYSLVLSTFFGPFFLDYCSSTCLPTPICGISAAWWTSRASKSHGASSASAWPVGAASVVSKSGKR